MYIFGCQVFLYFFIFYKEAEILTNWQGINMSKNALLFSEGVTFAKTKNRSASFVAICCQTLSCIWCRIWTFFTVICVKYKMNSMVKLLNCYLVKILLLTLTSVVTAFSPISIQINEILLYNNFLQSNNDLKFFKFVLYWH